MLHRICFVALATLGPLACATTGAGDPDPIEETADSPREAPPSCAALVADDDGDPDAKLRMLAELHDATAPGDPDLPILELRLARAAIAVGLLGSGCDALQRAHAHGDAEVVAAASEALEHCCVDVPPTAAAPAPPPMRCERRDAEAACDEDGDAACCMVATIKHEYEWLEARKGGDAEAAKAHETRYLELLERACDGEHAAACDQLASHRGVR
jgi:hypothetical protein